MNGKPDPSPDPYRTLGLEPGASMAEVKRAYRLLAKAFHPDSAGEAAVPRFLAIHEAYEQLRTGKVVAGPKASASRAAPTSEPWRADPARAQAARERARRARSKPSTGSGTAGSGTAGSGSAGSRTAGASGRASTGTSSGRTRTGRRRDVRKATMGSTSYDEVRDPGDATWSGASWYGPSSGEYWIVNPREYADPRKHGPEYQQRARRPIETDAPEAVAAAAFEGPRASANASARAARPAESRPIDPTWRTNTGPAESATAPSRYRPGETTHDPGLDPAEQLGAASRAWLGRPADDPIRRLGLALVAWPPIGLAAAAAIGEVTGCTTYSAACGGSDPLLPWLAQAAILGLLLLLPPVARILAGGAIAVLIALVPITVILLAMGASAAPPAGIVLAALLGAAWLVGIAWAARTFSRRLGRGLAQ